MRVVPHSLIGPLIEGLDAGFFTQRSEWKSLASSPSARGALLHAFDTWHNSAPGMDARALAFGLQVAMQTEQWRQYHPSAELVWSGPKISGSNWRQTEAALLQVIESAQERLWMVTFAAYRVEQLSKALKRAIARGVAVHFLAETHGDSEGRLSFDAALALQNLPAVHIYHWPREKRLMEDGRLGVLHAKCAVADRSLAFVSSANLTDNALHLNIEIGALLHGSPAARLYDHLQHLVIGGVICGLDTPLSDHFKM